MSNKKFQFILKFLEWYKYMLAIVVCKRYHNKKKKIYFLFKLNQTNFTDQ